MPEDLTLNQLVKIAIDAGIKIDFWDRIQQECGGASVNQSYVILITNSVFMTSRNKKCAEQKELVVDHGCELPTVQEYATLCVLTNKTFQKCLYRQGQAPCTYARSSTHVGGNPVVVGGATLVHLGVYGNSFDYESFGAGGRRIFRAIGL